MSREFRPLLGLRLPPRAAWALAIGVGLSITAVGLVAELIMGHQKAPYGLEYFAYQALAPGLGEELSLRGPWLALLAVGLARWRVKDAAAWVLLLSALPFALLHVLEPMPTLSLALILASKVAYCTATDLSPAMVDIGHSDLISTALSAMSPPTKRAATDGP